ncbi:hypothetical protein ACR6C2_44600 [Streptomyces sp. INA 01156]
MASVLALHLLRLRAEAGIARRVSTGRLRVTLREGAATGTGPGAASALPAGPWRVVAFGSPTGPTCAGNWICGNRWPSASAGTSPC